MFAQAQALWQESAASVAIGASRNSSLLRDERESGLNAALASLVRAGQWRGRLNLLEVNNICDGGPQLLAAMRADGGDRRRQRGVTHTGRHATDVISISKSTEILGSARVRTEGSKTSFALRTAREPRSFVHHHTNYGLYLYRLL